MSTEPIAGGMGRLYTVLHCPTLSYTVLPHTRTILHGEARCPAQLSGATLARRMLEGREERTGQEHNRHREREEKRRGLSNWAQIKHNKSEPNKEIKLEDLPEKITGRINSKP